VGGDYSSAAFLIAASCIKPSDVKVSGLRVDRQGDRAFVDILRRMGASLIEEPDGIRIRGPERLHGLELDCADIPDLVPILCVLGAFASGRTVLKNISHLRHKESDRLVGPTDELRLMGARISSSSDSISVEKSDLRPARVSARGDHRLAMSLIVAGIAAGGAEIGGVRSIAKSYPSFIRDIRALGARIE
jgi:3-phosphoshikimate 1-carboxyvinyltransferase